MKEIVEKIKALPIIDVITSLCGVELNYNDMMVCPFHTEDTPSLKVYSKTNTFKCFGCNKQGDAIEFVQSYHKLTFVGAVEMISNIYGLGFEKQRSTSRDYSFVSGYNRVADFGSYCLSNSSDEESLKVLNYLLDRGLTEETIVNFRLGYLNERILNSDSNLEDFFRKEKVSEENIISLSKHKGRLLIPLYNGNGSQVLGFASRGLSKESCDKVGKYTNDMNSSYKYGFNKSAYLYGYHLLQPNTFVYVVEGYLDAIFMHQLKLNAVGIGGTSITDTHASVLKKKFETIIMGFDNDKPGVIKTFENLSRFDGAEVQFVLWPFDVKDAGDFILKYPGEEISTGNILEYISHLWFHNFLNIQEDCNARFNFCDVIIRNTKHLSPIMQAEIETIIVKLIKEFVTY